MVGADHWAARGNVASSGSGNKALRSEKRIMRSSPCVILAIFRMGSGRGTAVPCPYAERRARERAGVCHRGLARATFLPLPRGIAYSIAADLSAAPGGGTERFPAREHERSP